MFAAVLITAVVAVPVLDERGSSSRRPTASWLMITLATFALGDRRPGRDPARQRRSSGLRLFFVYAAAPRRHGRRGRPRCTRSSRSSRRSSARRRCSAAAAIYGATTKRNLNSIGGVPVHGHDRDPRRVDREHLPGQLATRLGDRAHRRRHLHGLHRVRRPEDQLRRLRRRPSGRWRRRRSSGRLHLYVDFINIFLFLLRLFGSRR